MKVNPTEVARLLGIVHEEASQFRNDPRWVEESAGKSEEVFEVLDEHRTFWAKVSSSGPLPKLMVQKSAALRVKALLDKVETSSEPGFGFLRFQEIAQEATDVSLVMIASFPGKPAIDAPTRQIGSLPGDPTIPPPGPVVQGISLEGDPTIDPPGPRKRSTRGG